MSTSPSPMPPSGGSNVMTALVAGGLLALAVSNVYLYVQVKRLDGELATSRTALTEQLGTLKQSSASDIAASQRHIDDLREQLSDARTQARAAASEARTDAEKKAEALAKELSDAQKRQEEQVASQINQVQDTFTAKVNDVTGDVNNVKSQVATKAEKTDLDKTVADLKKVTGDLGVTSGYVATNSSELSALKRLNERNYFEFTINKSAKQGQRVGDVNITLKKTDQKRNRYTLQVLADDKLTEKKDRTINEPVQFYVAKARQPYEIVVNEVSKDTIRGYLATPKDTTPRSN